MPRKNLIRSKNLPFHVTARSNNKEWFSLPMGQMWQLAQDSLSEAMAAHPVSLVSFVLMGNHYHMLLLTPEGNLDSFMYEFNKRLAIKIKSQTGQINHIFGGRYKWCLIESQKYLINCYRYIYQNPVRAEMVTRCEDYPFSTLGCLLGKSHCQFPLHDPYGFKDEYGLLWLNERVKVEDVEALRRKLYRAVCRE